MKCGNCKFWKMGIPTGVYLHKVSDEDMKLYNKSNSTAWNKHYKADKVRKRYENQQKEEHSS